MNPPLSPDRAAFMEEFCSRLQNLIDNSPLAGLRATCTDGKENLRAIGEAVLGQMNVATRAELATQNAILAETVERLAQLEERVAQLEQQLKSS